MVKERKMVTHHTSNTRSEVLHKFHYKGQALHLAHVSVKEDTLAGTN